MGAVCLRSGWANFCTFGNPRMRCGKPARLNFKTLSPYGGLWIGKTSRIRNRVLEELQDPRLDQEEN
jgi:hypothetical protein